MKLRKLSIVLASALLFAGCVTINIYFPASAAEKAADKIIDDIWQARSGAGATGTSSAPGTSATPAVPPATNDKTVTP